MKRHAESNEMQNKKSKKNEFEYQIKEIRHNIKLLTKTRSYDQESPQETIINIVKDNQELGAEALTMLAPLLDDFYTDTRYSSRYVVSNIGTTNSKLGDQALTMLAPLLVLDETDIYVKKLTKQAIVNIVKTHRGLCDKAISLISLLLNDENVCTRESVKDAIRNIGAINKEFGRDVLTFLALILTSDEDFHIKESIIDLIGDIGVTYSELGGRAFDSVAHSLNDEYWQVRILAMKTMVNIGEAHPELANKILNILRELSIDKDPEIQELANYFISGMIPEELSRQDSIPAIIEDEDSDIELYSNSSQDSIASSIEEDENLINWGSDSNTVLNIGMLELHSQVSTSSIKEEDFVGTAGSDSDLKYNE